MDISSRMLASQLWRHAMLCVIDFHVMSRTRRERMSHGVDMYLSLFLSPIIGSRCRVRNEITKVLSRQTVYVLSQMLFWCYYSLCIANRKINFFWLSDLNYEVNSLLTELYIREYMIYQHFYHIQYIFSILWWVVEILLHKKDTNPWLLHSQHHDCPWSGAVWSSVFPEYFG